MNIAITDGVQLSPPGFAAGLGVWSREDGTPGTATWSGAANAALVPADQDFGSCLEIYKTDDTTRLRYMAETPILPGCYLKISARVKAVAGNLPGVRIAAFPGNGRRERVTGLVQQTDTVNLTSYGRVVEVSAIVGSGKRRGVDMVWGTDPIYGHFGLDLTGANGGSVRIESIRIEDVTSVFLRSMLDWVDVRDFGAVGDGKTDDRAAFVAANAAAAGREIVVPAGTYYIGSDLAISAPIRFVGRVTMPRAARLALTTAFDFPTYADAFGDENEGFKRAIQALLGPTDHNTLDLRGRRVSLTAPIDMAEIAPSVKTFSNRRVICNGEVQAVPGSAWTTATATSQASYSTSNPRVLSNVVNVANIEIGSRVSGPGVGREVYVQSRNVGARTLTLSQPLFGGSGTRSYSFARYRYLFDFSGMERLDRLNFADVSFLCDGVSSGIMLAPSGEMIHVRDCFMVRPRDRGITSIGRGCQDLLIDRCQFLSNEMDEPVAQRSSIAINVNANDVKIRENRFVRFHHFLVAAGAGHMIVGNHWFQGDSEEAGPRRAGLVIANLNVQVTVTANYIDNNSIEWTNEYEEFPAFTGNQYSFGGLVVTGNTFLISNSSSYFAPIIVKPYGAGHFVHGLTVSGNVFKDGSNHIVRVDRVDTTYADLDYTRMRNIDFSGNTFNGIDTYIANPLTVRHDQNTAASSWEVSTAGQLPFESMARGVDSIVSLEALTDANGGRVTEMPHIAMRQGSDQRSVRVNFSKPVKGAISLRIRMDEQK